MNWPDTRLCDLLGTDHPIIQAPMAGASTPAMAAAASNAGALGSLGCAMLSPEQFRAEMRETFALTNRPINTNFFVHQPPKHDEKKAKAAQDQLKPWFEEFDLDEVPDAVETNFPFDDAMCEALLEMSPRVASFHFGLPIDEHVHALKAAGIIILSSATSAEEARWLEHHGADAVIAQGFEAGGHSGWFLPRGISEVAGIFALLPRIADAVSVPVIAAGGIADGRGIAAALLLGASGVQIGTAFLATPESSISQAHKDSIISASGDDTLLSTAFSGRPARTIENRFASEMAGVDTWPDFPIGNTLTGPVRKASAGKNKPDAIALWSGQAVGLVGETTTSDLIARLVDETSAALSSLGAGR